MKKKVKLIIFILLIIFLFYSGWKLLLKEQINTYKANKYTIQEHFYKTDSHNYEFIITKQNENYTFLIEKNIKKKTKIIKKIKNYKKNNLICIYPIYKTEIEKNIYCNLDNNQVSIDYLIKTNNKDFKSIQKKLKKEKINYPTSNEKSKKYRNINIYQKNIEDNHTYYLWDYKGIIIINNKNISYQKILDYDLYDNVMATTIDSYYVLFENTSVNGIENIYFYDNKKKKLNVFKLKEKIDKNSYINGVIDNLIYVTDKKNKKEYTIDIKKEHIEEIDNDQTSYIVYENGIKKELSISDFFMQNHYFQNNYIEDIDITRSEELIKEDNYYYYKDNNKIYRVLETNKKNKTLLLELDDIKKWEVVDKEIILLKEGTVYSYTDKSGLRKILESNELNYNYNNIYKYGKN